MIEETFIQNIEIYSFYNTNWHLMVFSYLGCAKVILDKQIRPFVDKVRS